jgi:hypothetical protein
MTTRRAALLLLSLAPTLPLFAACDAEETQRETVGCDSTRQCGLYEVCNVLEGICVPEPEQAVLGSFYCAAVYGGGTTPGIGSFSEVAGKVNLINPKGDRELMRANQIAPPGCQLVEGVLYLGFFDPQLTIEGQGVYVRVAIDPNKLRPLELVDVTDPENYQAWAARGELRIIETDFMQSGDTSIKIYVDRAPVEGEPLRGFVAIDFEDLAPAPPPPTP